MLPERTLVSARIVAVPLGMALLVEPIAWAALLLAGPIGPGWYGRAGLLVAVHLLTIGALALPILGAGWQLVAVLAGRLPSPAAARVARAATLLALVGAPLLWLGLSGRWAIGAVGGVMVALGLLARSAVVIAALARASGRKSGRAWLIASELSLVAGLAWGLALLSTRAGFPVVTDPIAGIGAHATLLLAGWAGGQVIGWLTLLLPMFALGPDPGGRVLAVAAGLWFAGIAFGQPAIWGVGAVLAVVRLAFVLVDRGRALGPSLGLVAFGLGGLALLGVAAILGVSPGPWAVVAALVLWLLPIQHGIVQRIGPFLVWAHVLASVRGAPSPGGLVPTGPAWASTTFGVLGGPLLVSAVAWGFDPRPAVLLLGAASLAQLVAIVGLVWRTGLAHRRSLAIPGMEAR